ncbi:hypothetical protein Aperf_G00000015725 [Anoplocephala perfoliata]
MFRQTQPLSIRPVLVLLSATGELGNFAAPETLEELIQFDVLEGEPDTRLNAVLIGAEYAWDCQQPIPVVIAITAAEMAEGYNLRVLQRSNELLRHAYVDCCSLGDQTLDSRIEAAYVAIHLDMENVAVLRERTRQSVGCESQSNLRIRLANHDVSYGGCFSRSIMPTVPFSVLPGLETVL